MLDLGAIDIKYFDVKLPDGRVLNIRKPSKAMYDYMLSVGKVFTKLTEKEIVDRTYEYATKIFNRNVNDVELTPDWVRKNIKVELCDMVITEYTKFSANLTSNPN